MFLPEIMDMIWQQKAVMLGLRIQLHSILLITSQVAIGNSLT